MIRIASDHWRLWCDPDMGVQWMAAQVQRQGQWHSVVPDCRPTTLDNGNLSGIDDNAARAGQSADSPLPAANFHMLPYSNRIRDGQFVFQGRSIQLNGAATHAIHGALRKLPWRLLTHTANTLVCEIQSRDHQNVNWPWPMLARISHHIEGDSLSSTLSIINQGEHDMPAGMGWHPYFVRLLNGSPATLSLPVNSVFPDSNGDCLPIGPAIELPPMLDFRKPHTLDSEQRIDHCFSGLQGTCIIDWRDAGIQLLMNASEICRFLILYNPDMPHFALEPVTNANDAFNLACKGIDGGMQVLAPGESLQATMTLRAVVS